jgi:hypothetical protein
MVAGGGELWQWKSGGRIESANPPEGQPDVHTCYPLDRQIPNQMQRESVRLRGDVRGEHELAVGGDAFELAAALAFAADFKRDVLAVVLDELPALVCREVVKFQGLGVRLHFGKSFAKMTCISSNDFPRCGYD